MPDVDRHHICVGLLGALKQSSEQVGGCGVQATSDLEPDAGPVGADINTGPTVAVIEWIGLRSGRRFEVHGGQCADPMLRMAFREVAER